MLMTMSNDAYLAECHSCIISFSLIMIRLKVDGKHALNDIATTIFSLFV